MKLHKYTFYPGEGLRTLKNISQLRPAVLKMQMSQIFKILISVCGFQTWYVLWNIALPSYNIHSFCVPYKVSKFPSLVIGYILGKCPSNGT
jgi:hypothetical protein